MDICALLSCQIDRWTGVRERNRSVQDRVRVDALTLHIAAGRNGAFLVYTLWEHFE